MQSLLPFHGNDLGCSPEFNRLVFSMRMRTGHLGRKTSIVGMFSEGAASSQPRSSRRRVELVNEEPGFIFSFAFAITLFKEYK
jgi:hypothetical protein